MTTYTKETFVELQRRTGSGTDRFPLSRDIQAAKNLLRDCAQILISNKIETILLFGSLLGYFRDNDLIPHDVDMDIGVLNSNNIKKIRELIEKGRFKEKGILAIKGREFSLFRDGFYVDFYCFKKEGSKYFSTLGYPVYFLEEKNFPLQKINFLGMEFSTVSNINEYIVDRYGTDWKKPKKNHGSKF
jgi:predicted nucleotidyltransferase